MSNKSFLNWERQFRYLVWTKIFGCALYVQPVLILYYGTKGLTLSDFFLIQPIFSLTTFFLQVPCGYLSDKWKRVNVMRLGIVFTVMGTYWMFFAEGIFQLAFVPFFFACGFSLSSSSYGAIVYDSLLSLKRADEFPKVIGQLNAIGRYALAFSALFSGLFYSYYIHLPVFVQMVSMFFYTYFTWQVMEPQRKKQAVGYNHMHMIAQTIKYVLYKHVDLKWVILILCVIAVANTKAYWVIQPLVSDIENFTMNLYFVKFEIQSTYLLGLAAAITFTLSGVAAQLTHKIEHVICAKKLLLFAAICSFTSYAFAGLSSGLLMPIFLLGAFVAFGVAQVVTQTMINERVTSDIRATTLAITSSTNGLIFSIVTPVFAWGINAVSINFAMLCMGIYIAIATLTAWFFIKKEA
ncbi:MAG: MFS family permease [Alphaproteobacteria bacterium]|jgi:MFS family permease